MKVLLSKVRETLRKKQTRKILTRFISVFSAVIVFITTYALILPAITLELKASCGIEEHQHSSECYEERLICDQEEGGGHHHDDSCYELRSELDCEIEEHQHSAENGCYDADGNLICELAEHVHDDSCYREVKTLVCGEEESDGHHHTDACYEKVLVCEKEAHTHSKQCYKENAQEASEDETSNAMTSETEDAAADETAAASDEEVVSEPYVPDLEPLNMETVLDQDTDFYYFHAEEGQELPADSTDISDWKQVKEDTELVPTDLVKMYLSYSIPAGSLNATNPVARYRLPGNIHLTDDQVDAINENENGFYVGYVISNDAESAKQYLGAEAVEGDRTPDEQPDEGAQEYIGAIVRAENVYEGGRYLGQDLIFTFIPYTIEKNQNTYDAEQNLVSAGESVTGWFACDFKLDQIDWDEEETIQEETVQEEADSDNADISDFAEKSAEFIFAEESEEENIEEISRSLRLVEETIADGNEEDSPEEDGDVQEFKPGTLTADGDGYKVRLDYTEEAQIPEDAALSVREITEESDKEAYESCLAQARDHMSGSGDENAEVDTKASRFFDIEILVTEEDGTVHKIEPAAPVQVSIQIPETASETSVPGSESGAAQKADPRVLHFAEDGVEQVDSTTVTGDVSAEGNEDGTNKDVDADAGTGTEADVSYENGEVTQVQFEAESFSVYGLVYAQIKKDFITATGETFEIIVTYEESAEIPDGATLEITEFADGSDEFQAAREYVTGKKQSEDSDFDDNELGIAAFDLSILDEDGRKVEPKTAVSVELTMKHMPEEIAETDAQNSIEIHHLDESSGDVSVETVASAADGSIQIENETARAEFQLESFSTFTVSWNRRSTSNSTVTFGWQDSSWPNPVSRGYITAQYQDESGNAIQRPNNVNYTVYHSNFNDGVTNSFNIADELGRPIDNYSFTGAYVTVDGEKQQVDTVTATRAGDVTTVTYYYNGQEVLSASYDATYAQNKRHDFTPDGLGLTLEYTKNSDFTTVHYGYMDGDTFVEFEQQPAPTNTSTDFGWAHLIYDFAGTDDQGLHVDWKYSGTYYHTSETTNPEEGGAAMQPILRYSSINNRSAWRYYDGSIDTYGPVRQDQNWHEVADGSDIYVVYEKPVIPMGGNPTLRENTQLPNTPYILKESVSNTDGTNTLSLSVTGSRAPMEASKIADVIVILDLSSSMRRDIGSTTAYDNNYQTNSRSRYYQAKKAVQTLADKLYEANGTDGEQYRMGLVTFSNKGTIRQYPTDDKTEFQSVLDGITAYEGSGTNWEHSLQLANQMAVSSDRATYIVFITDGEPSVRQTRGNLTNEQLSGVNNTTNPAAEGDIFHGGRSNGRFFDNNSPWNQDTTTPDFRDYFGSATFGGLMNNDVWDPRNRNAAIDEVASIVGHHKGFFAIGVSEDVNYLGDFVEAGGVDSDHYKLVTSEKAFQEVIDEILEELDMNGSSGQANVKIYDGITDLTQTISKVNQEENRLIGVDGNFVYYKSTAPADWSRWTTAQKAAYALGVEYADSSETPTEYESYTQDEIDAYNLGKNISFNEWTSREEDGCAEAVYNTETGAVEWNMGQTFMLEDGVTYKVSFICWPSQEAYDIIAKLNNGTITFGDTDLYPQEVWDQFDGDVENGYYIKTNEDGANTKYNKATIVNGTLTVGDEQDPLPFQDVPPMPLAKDRLNVGKTWQASRIDTQDPESVVLQVVGNDELYKEFEIIPTTIVGDSETPNYGRSGDIYISCGHLKVNKNTGEVIVYESGHDFTLREVEENSRHWDLDASVCRPMKINTAARMLVLVAEEDVPAGMTSDIYYYTSGGYEYYRIDGKVYKDMKEWADITGMNTRRSFLDLGKEVLVDDEVWTDQFDTKFTYKITINVDPTTLSWDPDIEKYVIISIRGDGYSPAAAIADEDYPTTAVLPSESGLDSSLINEGDDDRYLVAESGEEFYLSIKNGWSVRFLNLPAGTTYSIEEVLPGDSNFDFNNVRLETRKDKDTVNPDTAETYSSELIEGTISETSTLYKVVYQNDAKSQEIRILKTSQDASTPLGGAKFDLYTQDAYTATPQGQPLKKDLVSSSASATKGQIDLGFLPVGIYYLVETYAPDGYIRRTDPVIITVTKTSVTYDDGTNLSQSGGISQIGDTYQLKVTNDEGAVLPSTGGPGTRLFTILGTILIAGAGLLMLRKRRVS